MVSRVIEGRFIAFFSVVYLTFGTTVGDAHSQSAKNYWPPRGFSVIARDVSCESRQPSQRALIRQRQGAPIVVKRTAFLRAKSDRTKAPPPLRNLPASKRRALESCFRNETVQPPTPPTPCTISLAAPDSIAVMPGHSRAVGFRVSTTCSSSADVQISGYPAGGIATITGRTLTYSTHPSDGTGDDSVTIVACAPKTTHGDKVCSKETTIAIRRCDIQVPPVLATVRENETSSIPLRIKTSCGSSRSVELVTLPTIGGVSNLSAAAVSYTVGFAQGTDSFAIRACDPDGAGCAPPSTVTVTILPGPDFLGREESLAPYRAHISGAEREHLVRKLANNRFDLIKGAGMSLPLMDLIRERFLDETLVSPDLVPILTAVQSKRLLYGRPIPTEEFIPAWKTDFNPQTACPPSSQRGAPEPGACFQPVIPPTLDLNDPSARSFAIERWMMTTDRSWHGDNFRYHWGYHLTTSRYLKRARYLSPLHTKMWHFWSGHFGTNTQIINGFQENLVGYYIGTIEREAFGNFRAMMLGREGGADSNGCAPLTPWNPNHGSILCDAASNMWLSNNVNEGKNQDFARELLELYLLSPIDEFTNSANYSDDLDIIAGARFVSGIRVNQVKALAPGQAPVYAPVYDPAKHDTTPGSMFQGAAMLTSERTLENVSLEPGDLVRHLFDHDPALPRFIAAKLFATFVYPDPSEALVAELGAELKRLDFDLRAFLELILTSEAMFSPRAAGKNCVSSPLEVYSRIINTVGLPMIPLQNAPDAVSTYLYTIDDNLNGAGENILGYPTVFGYDYCGRAPGIDGSSAWLFSHLLIARVTNFTRFLNAYMATIQPQYDLRRAIDVIMAEPEFADGSPESVIDFFARRFDISFDASEREILREYLTHRRTGRGSLQPVTWATSDGPLMREKIAGLMVILATFDQSATH